MLFTSVSFFLFLPAALIIYYSAPLGRRWIALLFLSIFWYGCSGTKPLFLLLGTAFFIWKSSLVLEEKRERSSGDRSAGLLFILSLLLPFTVLFVFKYSGDVFGKLILPVGISYYTFQAVGYLMDVYWGRVKAEKNPFRLMLFLMYFPQLLQGPIGRYKDLSADLYEGHLFDGERFLKGLERITFGIFKSMLAAGWGGFYRRAVFEQTAELPGTAFFGVLFYTVELYGSFSGGIDIALGISQLFGISLSENFRQPFFAVSVQDFWTRWHITLGTWMKEYVMYPLTLSHFMKGFGKYSKRLFGKKYGRLLPPCLSSIIVFMLVGIWHGPGMRNLLWGLFNGVVIAAGILFESSGASLLKRLGISDDSRGLRFIRILRTFIIMNLSWYFDLADSFSHAVNMIKHSLTEFRPSELLMIDPGRLSPAAALGVLLISVMIIFTVDLLNEKHYPIERSMASLPSWVRVGMMLLAVFVTAFLSPVETGGFIYAQF